MKRRLRIVNQDPSIARRTEKPTLQIKFVSSAEFTFNRRLTSAATRTPRFLVFSRRKNLADGSRKEGSSLKLRRCWKVFLGYVSFKKKKKNRVRAGEAE